MPSASSCGVALTTGAGGWVSVSLMRQSPLSRSIDAKTAFAGLAYTEAMAEEIPLSLRQLQYYVVVAEVGSITRAAERLLISQPSLSHQLRALEATVGA